MKQDERKRKRGKEKKWARGADEKDERRKGKRAPGNGTREKGKREKRKGERATIKWATGTLKRMTKWQKRIFPIGESNPALGLERAIS